MGWQMQPWRSLRSSPSGQSSLSGKSWRSGNGERLWLSMLVDAMEEFSRPDIRSRPCHPSLLVAVRERLAQPVSSGAQGGARFSLRH
jgi:hypothetical protein